MWNRTTIRSTRYPRLGDTAPNLRVLNGGARGGRRWASPGHGDQGTGDLQCPRSGKPECPHGYPGDVPRFACAHTDIRSGCTTPVALLQQLGTRRGSLAVFIRTLGRRAGQFWTRWRAAEPWRRCDRLQSSVSAEPLFDKAATWPSFESWAAMQGWKVLPQPEDGDPDLLNLHLVPLATRQEVQLALDASLEGACGPPIWPAASRAPTSAG